MRKLVLGLIALLLVAACEFKTTNNTPKYFFGSIDEAMRYKPQSANDSTPYIYCKYIKRDTLFDESHNPIQETEQEMNDVIITLGNDTVFLEVPFKFTSATLDFWTTKKLFTKDGSKSNDFWEFKFMKLKDNRYYITTEKFPRIPRNDNSKSDAIINGFYLKYKPTLKITTKNFDYKTNSMQSFSNQIEYYFDEVTLGDMQDIGASYKPNQRYYWVGEENQKKKFENWLQYNSIFEK